MPYEVPGVVAAMRYRRLALIVLALVNGILTAATPISAQEYLLGPGDVLDVVVFGEADLTRTVTIRADGKITLPLVGELIVTGLSAPQVAGKVTDALRRYLKHPQVTVTLAQARGAFVHVMGQVQSPGSFEFQPGWTVIEAIAKAGGVTERAALRKAVLIRKKTDQTMPIDLDRLILKGDQTADVLLEPGDVILIPELQNRVLVLGSVKAPGAYDLKEGAALLDAVAAAGGPSEKAALGSVAIIRRTPQGYAPVMKVDLGKILGATDPSQNVVLQHADIVFLPNRPMTLSAVMQWLGGINMLLSIFGF